MSYFNDGSFVATKLFIAQSSPTSSLPPSLQFGVERLKKTATSPMGLLIGGIVIFLVVARFFNNGEKAGKVATGYWGGGKEKSKAAKKAKKQIQNPKRNSVA
ncbi:MAG TPA: hypothetical protein DCE56_35255, partial [Cyanobacteria bacterium UBA8553]|nr:hypothetical protein [Cyanobacteria bacterium UBA8553]